MWVVGEGVVGEGMVGGSGRWEWWVWVVGEGVVVWVVGEGVVGGSGGKGAMGEHIILCVVHVLLAVSCTMSVRCQSVEAASKLHPSLCMDRLATLAWPEI